MKREGRLLILIAFELIIGAMFTFRAFSKPPPPIADLSLLDPIALKQLNELTSRCQSPNDWVRLGEVYAALGYFREAEACYRGVYDPERRFEWGFILERLGEIESANEKYRSAIDAGHPRPNDIWYFIGRNHLRLEQANEAMFAFVRAERQPSAQYETARLLVREQKWRPAGQILDELIQRYPRASAPYLLRAEIDRVQGTDSRLPTPFDREWQRLTDLYQKFGVQNNWITAHSLIEQRKYEEAEQILKRGLNVIWDTQGEDLLAEIELLTGRVNLATQRIENILAKEGPSIEMLIRLGDCHEEAGEIPKALATWERAAKLGSPNAVIEVHMRMANHYQKLGNEERTKYHRERAIKGQLRAGNRVR